MRFARRESSVYHIFARINFLFVRKAISLSAASIRESVRHSSFYRRINFFVSFFDGTLGLGFFFFERLSRLAKRDTRKYICRLLISTDGAFFQLRVKVVRARCSTCRACAPVAPRASFAQAVKGERLSRGPMARSNCRMRRPINATK